MPRPRSFDETDVLRIIMRLFWTGGYGATSMDDIERATGVLKPSLYRCYGNKEAMFLKAHQLYQEEVFGPLMEALDSKPGLDGVRAYFRCLVDRLIDCDYPSSCFVAKVSNEEPAEGSIRALIADAVAQIEDRLYRVLHRAQADGAVRPDVDPRALARLLLCMSYGLESTSSATPDRGVLEDSFKMFDRLLTSVESPASAAVAA